VLKVAGGVRLAGFGGLSADVGAGAGRLVCVFV